MFNKNDIKTGYVVKLSDGEYCTVNVNNRNQNGIRSARGLHCDICNFDENLYCEWRDIYIDEVYGRTANGFLNNDSPNERELIWRRNDYQVGDKFIISNISIQNNCDNYIKITNYENVEAIINQACDIYNNTMYNLSFNKNSIMVDKEYLKKCKKI